MGFTVGWVVVGITDGSWEGIKVGRSDDGDVDGRMDEGSTVGN